MKQLHRLVVLLILCFAFGCASGSGSPDTAGSDDITVPPQDSTQSNDTTDQIIQLPDLVQLPDSRPDLEPDPDVTGEDAQPDSVDTTDSATPEGPPRYTEANGIHSPLTPLVVANLKKISANNSGRDDTVFMKVGDSITDTSWFLACFSGTNYDLDGRDELKSTISYFDHDISGSIKETSWNRDSDAMRGGKTAWWMLNSSDVPPYPLKSELTKLNPRFAMVMLGTNDIGWFEPDMIKSLEWYRGWMETLLDELIAEGVIPIVMAIPPRTNRAILQSWTYTLNAMLRGYAERNLLPFIDYHTAMLPLPTSGLSTNDGIHPTVYSAGACKLTVDGLKKGYNMRNLVALEGLQRVKSVMIDGLDFLDPPVGAVTNPGDGSPAKPFVINGLPFSDIRDSSKSPHRSLSSYSGCNASQDESGPEFVYRLEISKTTRIRAIVLDDGDVDIDLHLLKESPTEAACIKRHDKTISAELSPGTWYIVLDTFVSGGSEKSGEFLFVVHRCADDDALCL